MTLPMAPAAKHWAWASSLLQAVTRAGRQPASTTAPKARGEDVATRDRAPTPYRCRMGSLLLAHLPSPAQNSPPLERTEQQQG